MFRQTSGDKLSSKAVATSHRQRYIVALPYIGFNEGKDYPSTAVVDRVRKNLHYVASRTVSSDIYNL